MINSKKIKTSLLVLLIIILSVASLFLKKGPEDYGLFGNTESDIKIPTEEQNIQNSKYIFVGTIKKEVGREGIYTLFEVEIIDNIKGTLKDSVIISQKYEPLIQVGTTYLLLVRSLSYSSYLTVMIYQGALPITSDTNLSKSQLDDLVKKNETVKKYKEIYERSLNNTESINYKEVRLIQVQLSANLSDNKILVGAAHNVFVAKVTKEVGNPENLGVTNTRFEVEVIYNIKGSLKEKVIVDQEGGYKGGVLYVMNEDILASRNINDYGDYLLQLGKTYLLATRFNPDKNWYNIAPHPNGRKTISTNPNLSKSQLESIVRNDPKVQALQEAYKNEILLDADVYHNNTRNSYKSLHPGEEIK